MKCRFLLIRPAFALTILCMAGCYLTPNFGPQGTIGEQRTRAVLHDPFPSADLGPSIVGGRPKGFERPLAEPADLQGSPFSNIRRQPGSILPGF